MSVKLLTEHHLECLSLKRLLSSSESTLVKMPHCWKSHAAAQLYIIIIIGFFFINVHVQGHHIPQWAAFKVTG